MILVRSAQGLYWMSRYLARAEHLCRMMALQMEAMVDRPFREVHFGWSRIYGTMERTPPWGDIGMLESDEGLLFDSYTLAEDMTFERTHPESVWSCFAMGRENARQMRQCITGEMWLGLNLPYLRLQRMGIRDIWRASPETFYNETAGAISAFTGAAADTMYRDENWFFMRLGRAIEKSQLTAGLFLTQLRLSRQADELSDGDWETLLRLYHAFDAYVVRYAVQVEPGQVLDLLATDSHLPNSLSRMLGHVEEALEALGPGPDAGASDELRRLAGRVSALVKYEWDGRRNPEPLLDEVYRHCRDIHNLVSATYFDYPIQDAPER